MGAVFLQHIIFIRDVMTIIASFVMFVIIFTIVPIVEISDLAILRNTSSCFCLLVILTCHMTIMLHDIRVLFYFDRDAHQFTPRCLLLILSLGVKLICFSNITMDCCHKYFDLEISEDDLPDVVDDDNDENSGENFKSDPTFSSGKFRISSDKNNKSNSKRSNMDSKMSGESDGSKSKISIPSLINLAYYDNHTISGLNVIHEVENEESGSKNQDIIEMYGTNTL